MNRSVKSIKKAGILLLAVLLTYKNGMAQVIEIPQNIPDAHPRIYAETNGKIKIDAKLKNAEWAKEILSSVQNDLEPYMKRFDRDSTWLVSRLQMYWKSHHTDIYIKGTKFLRAEGHAAVPTVRFAGTRDWATNYKVPDLAALKPYDDKDDGNVFMIDQANKGEWVTPDKTGLVIERINQKILELAQNASFMYWYSGDERYAKFASIVLKTYIKGLYYRHLPVNTIDSQESYLTGLTSFEVIHEEAVVPTTVCYDFLYNYLKKTDPDFNTRYAAPVFKKWADNIIEKGVPDNNWNIFEMRYLSYLALALDNDKDYADGKGISYYLDVIYNKNFPRQTSFTKSLEGFDKNTGTWHEAPGYNLHVCEDMVGIVMLTDRVMTGKLLPLFSILKKAVLTTPQYLFPDKRIVAYGDSHYDMLPAGSFEFFISLARKYGNIDDEKKFTALLKYTQDEPLKRAKQKSLFNLFFYVDKLKDTPPATLADFAAPTFYAPNQSWFVQRNGFDEKNGLMISSNASEGNHSHSNGINMELYGKGYPLAPDFSSGESYWHPGYREFYAQFAAHNTVVVNGKSSYGTMLTSIPFQLKSCYPATEKTENYFKAVTFSNIAFTEPSTNAAQLRLLSIIRTSDTSGYYVDIFRSKKNGGGDIKHEYIYHNLGQQANVFDMRSMQLSLIPTNELSSAKGDVKGYDYYKDKTYTSYNQDFRTNFQLIMKDVPVIQMNVWMKGESGRQIFIVKSPKSYALNTGVVPNEIAEAEVPTLIVRQNGEAWTHPFAAIFEPSYTDGQTVTSMSAFNSITHNAEFVGLKVTNVNNTSQLIFSDVKGVQLNQYMDLSFKGTYAVASDKKGEMQYLFLGNGTLFSKQGYALSAINKPISAALLFDRGTLKLYAEDAIKLLLPVTGNSNRVFIEITSNGQTQKIEGRIITSGGSKQAEFIVPGLHGQVSTIKLKNS
ncbi:heparinase II/III-like protein [Mucilaginibacter gracilis]|uniref:Heparinase II/III-like protein n=1 Tax=Mucilaginibacter gracilis TaxID=423350 RepID=A0A495J6H6_9SPHI|nr:heparinase II/III family protein [Mucilaginibacter gracilis]RKR84590.1 heparinase II/III-like protein [Mucilaginibacter gracilis]